MILSKSLHGNEGSRIGIACYSLCLSLGKHWAHLYPWSTVIKETKKSRWGAVELSSYLVIRLPVFAIEAAVHQVPPCPPVIPPRMSLGRYGCDVGHIAQVHLQPLAPPVCCPGPDAVQPGIGCSTVLGATGGQRGVGQGAVLEPQRWAASYRTATNMVRCATESALRKTPK